MAIPDFQTLMLPVLRLAKDREIRVSDAVEQLAEEFGLSPAERAELLPSGRQARFANRVHWAKSYLGKAGLLELTRRAHFRATQRGLEVLNSPPERIDIRYLNQFPDFEGFRTVSEAAAPGKATANDVLEESSLTPDELMRQAHQEIELALADELLGRVRQASSAFFERAVVRLLIAMGYGGTAAEIDEALSVVGKSGDGGVDGVIDQDLLGLDRIYIQAKRYGPDSPIGPGAIRDFFGSLDRFKASKGLFVTTSSFSKTAVETADMLSRRIVLVDGKQLARLMIRHEVGCRVQETLHLKKVDEDFFDM